MTRAVTLLLVGLGIGYFIGFADGRRNDRNIVVRAIERVAGVAESTVGEREKGIKEEMKQITP